MTTRQANRPPVSRRSSPKLVPSQRPGADDRQVVAQRWTIVATLVGCLLLFWRSTSDSFSTPKLTVLFVGAVVLLALGAHRAVESGELRVPWTPAAAIAVGFVAVASATAVIGGLGMVSFLGTYSRYVGVLPYAAYVVLFLAVLRVGDLDWFEDLAWWLTLALGGIAAYGLLQAVGADPFTWTDTASRHAFSTLGQENFTAGVAATLMPLGLGVAAISGWRSTRGRASLVITAATILLIWRANSFQGPVAGVVAVLPIGFVVGLDRIRARRAAAADRSPGNRALAVAAAVPVVGAALLIGPFVLARTGDQLSSGTRERRYLWAAAWTLFRRHPLLGNGFGEYNLVFPRVRPAAHALRYGLLRADAPHDVWLEHLVSGGIVLAVVYFAFVAYTGWCLASGLRRLQGHDRLLLAAFGGGWLGYQVQALVSIDVPPVAVLHWVLAGVVIVLARRPELRSLRWSRAVAGGAARAATVGIVVVALVAGWFALRPLRADYASAEGRDNRRRNGDIVKSAYAYVRARDLAPWEPQYGVQLASAYADIDRTAQAIQAGERAARLDPGNTTLQLALAQAAETLGDHVLARKWYDVAVRNNPNAAATHNALGKFLVRDQKFAAAIPQLRRAARDAPSNSDYWTDLGTLLQQVGKRTEAIRAFERVVALEPGNDPIVLQLGHLYDAVGRHRDADAAFRSVLRRQPRNLEALNALGLPIPP